MFNLKLSDAKRPLVSETRRKSPRAVVLEGLQQQIELLKNPSLQVERQRYIKGDDGSLDKTTVMAKPRPWWWRGDDGVTYLQVRYGSSHIVEIEPGKPTIIVGKEGDLKKVLDTLMAAVTDGKLDEQISAAKEKAKRK